MLLQVRSDEVYFETPNSFCAKRKWSVKYALEWLVTLAGTIVVLPLLDPLIFALTLPYAMGAKTLGRKLLPDHMVGLGILADAPVPDLPALPDAAFPQGVASCDSPSDNA
jgi:hypothetical protein